MLEKPLTVRDLIEPAIMKAGGWVNTHAMRTVPLLCQTRCWKSAALIRCSRNGMCSIS